MIDSTDADRLEEVRQIFGLRRTTLADAPDRLVSNDEVEGVPVLMIANKQDVESSLKLEQIKEHFNHVAEKLGARDSRVLPVSALRGFDHCGVIGVVEWECAKQWIGLFFGFFEIEITDRLSSSIDSVVCK